VTVRKAFGFGSSIMAMNPFDDQTISLAFPAVTLGAFPADSGADPASLDASARERMTAEQADGSFRVAASLGYDDVIDPRRLRNALLEALALSAGRLAGPYAPQPGSIRP
jgi:hypothetical protein